MSPRRKIFRKVDEPPKMLGFKPFGIPFKYSGRVDLNYEEYEALRLNDYDKLTQKEASEIMDISRPTFTRIYESARNKIAKAMVEGKSLIINGGDYKFSKEWYRCNDCNMVYHSSDYSLECPDCKSENVNRIDSYTSDIDSNKGLGKYGVQNKYCYCKNCQTKVKHTPGQPCREIECPECGEFMVGSPD